MERLLRANSLLHDPVAASYATRDILFRLQGTSTVPLMLLEWWCSR